MAQTLYHGAQQFGLSLSKDQLAAFEQYSQALAAWNRRLNLTRIVEPEAVVVKHFLDSLSVYAAVAELLPNFSVIDVGSGAGFPGLPLKIALPAIQLTLLESTSKKAAFLEQLISDLKLADVTILTARAEEAGQQAAQREQYDMAVARAVAALPVLAEYMLPFVKVGGYMVAQKGQNPAAEIKSTSSALEILGGHLEQVLTVAVPGLEAKRHLVVIKKIAATPRQYPRRPGIPAKRPL